MINTTDTSPVQDIPPERIQSLASTLSRFFESGEHIEIRCLKPFRNGNLVASGGFTDPEEAAIWALSAEIDLGFNVYFGLNPRANKEPSHELQWGKAYSRRHVAYLRWVFIDFDPVRSGGSATANEKKHAYELMGKILRLLCNKYGWPRPIICDSGNGYHLLFRTNLTCEQRRLITIALKALADHFSTSHVKIDAGVDDAAQITRCYGTLNRKGSNTTERPWRYSQAFGEGVSPDLVTEKQLQLLPILYPPTSLASKTPAPKQERTKQSTPYTGQRYDVPAILTDCDLDYDHKIFETDEGDADLYELAECPWAEEHSTGPGGACVIQFPSGAVAFRCHHNSCSQRKWQDFKEALGITKPQKKTDQTNDKPEIQLGATHLAERINAGRGEDQPQITPEMIMQEAQRRVRSSASARSGEWKNYYQNADTLIVGCGLSIDEARPLLREYNARHKTPKTDAELEEVLRGGLQRAQTHPERIGELMQGKDNSTEEAASQQSMLNNLVMEYCELWHDSDQVPFATVVVGNHKETMPIKSGNAENPTRFEMWLDSQYYQAWEDVNSNGHTPSVSARLGAIRLAQGHAIHKGELHDVHIRVASHIGEDTKIYLDLTNENWEAVEITPTQWRVIPDPPVKFRRPTGMRPLPTPVKGGTLDLLREWWAMTDSDWHLLVGYLTMLLHPKGPYPILIVSGESGSAKTTFCETVRKLVDPSKADLNLVPTTERDVIIATNNSWVVAYDNLSYVSNHVSDMLCCVATGMGFRTRTLYSNDNETIFNACRPQLFNGIGDIAHRDDLLQRGILITLDDVPKYRSKEEYNAWYDAQHPRLLGALLDATCCALAREKAVTLDDPPRMVDYAKWITAAEPAIGLPEGTLLQAYRDNLARGTGIVLDQSTHIAPLLEFMESCPFDLATQTHIWRGTTRELLTELKDTQAARQARARGDYSMAQTPIKLGIALTRLTKAAKAMGLHIGKSKSAPGSKGGERVRSITYCRPADTPQHAPEEGGNLGEP